MNLRDILNILNDFNDTVPSWREILDEIDRAVQRYNAAIADPNVEDPAAYLRGWLPQYWQAVRAVNTYQWKKKEERLPIDVPYDVGIFLVGFSSPPIVLSIAEIQPRQEIYFIQSEDTRRSRKCDEITNRLTEMLEDPPADFDRLIDQADRASLITRLQSADRREIAEPSDPVSTFQEIKDIIDSVRDRLGNDARIALDLTGGKKTMIGGGFTAGSIYSVSPQCDMFYVDSLVYNPDLGAPKPGTEFLTRLENPYDVYNVQAVREAEKLFKAYNYEAAAVLWDGVSKKLDDPAGRLQSPAERYSLTNERDAAKKNRDMAICYRFWDAFDYEHAKQNKGTYKPECNKKHIHKGTDGSTIDILQILSEMTTAEQLFTSNEARVIHYVVDRYQNGMRRKKVGEFVDAIVRFTQVVELLCIYKMYQLKKNNHLIIDGSSGTIVSQNDLNKEEWSVSRLIRFLFGEYTTYYAYRQQWALSGCDPLDTRDYGAFTEPGEIVKLISHRNDFIHVNKSMRQEDNQRNSKNLQEFALKFLEKSSAKYCSEIDLPFKQLLELHEFRQL